MKFLRDKNLRHLGAYVVLLTAIIFVGQYFILGSKIEKLEEAELKREFTGIVQLANQRIALQMQDYLNGNSRLASEITAQLNEQEHRLGTLSRGGRVEQREEFVQPLTRLPRMTFQAMNDDWKDFRESIESILLAENTETPNLSPPVLNDTLNSTPVRAVLVNNKVSNGARVRYQGLSISIEKWFNRLMADLDEEVSAQKRALNTMRAILVVLNIGIAGGLYFLFFQFVLTPLDKLRKNGLLNSKDASLPSNEIGDLGRNIGNTMEQLKDASDFVSAIGKGNLSVDYKETFDHSYTPGTNPLADSLIEMQAKLRELNEEEEKRKWSNEGIARFVEILRSSNDNIHVLGDKVISGLVQYTKANQGGLYILNDEDESSKVLELVSLFAFDTKKHEQQRIKPGQGILGQTFLEKETTYLTSLPEEYIRITSGLGGANPKSVLVVPLKVDQDVYGLVELASFNEFQPHEIAFVEKLGESIASTLASVRAAQKNKSLIEQFQLQTQQMKAQEEEMRQNMEELQATQEEVVRKEKNYIERIAELEARLEEDAEAEKRFADKEADLTKKLSSLEQELEEARKKAGEWELASGLVDTLKVNIEAIRITEEELRRKKQ